jgi:hypothetical protein
VLGFVKQDGRRAPKTEGALHGVMILISRCPGCRDKFLPFRKVSGSLGAQFVID